MANLTKKSLCALHYLQRQYPNVLDVKIMI